MNEYTFSTKEEYHAALRSALDSLNYIAAQRDQALAIIARIEAIVVHEDDSAAVITSRVRAALEET